MLKPGGIFIFDVLNDEEIDGKLSSKNWGVLNGGNWREKLYIALSEPFFHKDEKVILFQHTIIDEITNVDVYRFWTSLFSHSDLAKGLNNHSYSDISFSKDVLPKEIYGVEIT